MLVVKVDVVRLELREGSREGTLDVGRFGVGDVGERLRIPCTELGGEEDFAAPASGGEPAPQDGFS